MAKKTKTFEDKLLELESLVDSMENSKQSLENIIDQYNAAQTILLELNSELQSLEQKIKVVNEKGEIEDFNE